MNQEIYGENIADHYHNPSNKGTMGDASISHRELNPLCGDELTLFLKVESGKIIDAKFSGRGCVMSQASADILLDEIKGKSLSEIKKMNKDQLLDLLGIRVGPLKIRCALLSFETLKNSVELFEGGGIKNGK